jgi:uncharacterized protein (TIGR02145 family)
MYFTNPQYSIGYTTRDGSGMGEFVSTVSGLTEGTTYYIAAYATNRKGTSWGYVARFATIDSLGRVTDIDGNKYRTVTIGQQVWMAENLKVTHYSHGGAITNGSGTDWSLYDGAYFEYNDDPRNVATYGRLYNWYAVNSRYLAPAGWRVPTDSDWQILVDVLGGDSIAGGKLKEVDTVHWLSPNAGATDEIGFSALPGGGFNNPYVFLGRYGYFWSATSVGFGNSYCRSIGYNSSAMYRSYRGELAGFSVRCVKD